MMSQKLSVLQRKSSYLKQFLISPRTTGTVFPSSRFLCEAMLEGIDWENGTDFVELGAGDGVLTKKILEKMSPQARLYSFEIRPEFVQQLKEIKDPRLTICDYSAEHLDGTPDVIFSCLPLVNLPKRITIKILKKSCANLKPNGFFVQFHYSRFSEKVLSRFFNWERTYVLRNIPPAFVYKCTPKKPIK